MTTGPVTAAHAAARLGAAPESGSSAGLPAAVRSWGKRGADAPEDVAEMLTAQLANTGLAEKVTQPAAGGAPKQGGAAAEEALAAPGAEAGAPGAPPRGAAAAAAEGVRGEPAEGAEGASTSSGAQEDGQGADALDAGAGGQQQRGDRRVFVGGIPYASTEAELGKFLSGKYGAVSEVKFIYDNASMKFKGYGFVLFREAGAAAAARAEAFVPFQSRTLNISKAVRNGGGGAGHVGGYANGAFMGHGHDEGGRRLALEGLPPDATDAGLREAMAGFGQVRHARVALDHTTGNCHGSGTVTFRSQAVANTVKGALARGAMAYNGHRLVLGHVFLPHQGHMGASFFGAHLPGMLPGHMPGYTSEGLYMPGLGAPGHPGAHAMRMSQHLPYGGVAGSHYGAMWDMYAASGYQQHLLAAQAQAQAAASQQYSAQAQQQYADAMAAQMAAQQQQQQQMGPDAAVADGGAAVALSPPPLAVAGSPPGMLVEFGERSAAGYGGSGGLTPSAPSA